jgi:DNA-binding transcriptional LysR family regulator
MIDKLRSMAVFSRVAEAGSFRRAAERLGLSASVVSHHVTQLETELGVQLLYRSTRHVALTSQGQRFYESCRSMLEAAESALGGLHEDQPSGRLWVLAPAPFSSGPFVADVAEFCALYPRVELRLEFDDVERNLIQEGIDVAITMGPPENTSLVCRTLFTGHPGIFAAPAYLAQSGAIETIEDLQNAHWVGMLSRAEMKLRHEDGRDAGFVPKRRVSVNNVIALHQLVQAGVGVAQLPAVLVAPDVASGRLVRLLPQWQAAPVHCCAVYPARTMPNSLARRFVDFIFGKMQSMGSGPRD